MKTLPPGVRAVLLDVEGTVGDISFVKTTLFPYAQAKMATFLEEGATSPEVAEVVSRAAELAGVQAGDHTALVAALLEWSDKNAKVPPLKTLQGLIWEAGYRDGILRAHLYDDVPPALSAWTRQGRSVAIYSSGSVLAQRLYFSHSVFGDLTRSIRAYFDTAVGPKSSPASYERIAASLEYVPQEIVFFSDAPGEIDAALEAGLFAIRVDRTKAPRDCGRDGDAKSWWGGFAGLDDASST